MKTGCGVIRSKYIPDIRRIVESKAVHFQNLPKMVMFEATVTGLFISKEPKLSVF